jgi:hypothetical protein
MLEYNQASWTILSIQKAVSSVLSVRQSCDSCMCTVWWASATSADAAELSEAGSDAVTSFRSKLPQIDVFWDPVFSFRDCLISTMNGFVCFAINPPGDESPGNSTEKDCGRKRW